MSKSRGRPPSQRQLRVGEEIRHALSQVLSESVLRDPELSEAAITVTEVRLSPDLKNATAFVMPLGGADLQVKVAALRRASAFLRGELARRLSLRFTPRLSFEPDHSFAAADRIESLLRSAKLRPGPADEGMPGGEMPGGEGGDEEAGHGP